MKFYAALPLAALLLASAAIRQPVASDTTTRHRDAVAEQVESILRNAGYPNDTAMQASGFISLPYHPFSIPGCPHGALAVTLYFQEFDLLRAAWARIASTFPDYRLSLHYGEGQWPEINRPAIAWEKIRLKFISILGTTTHQHDSALLVASHGSCEAPLVNWSEIWRSSHTRTPKVDKS